MTIARVLATAALAFGFSAAAAHADTRIFVISNMDGYGIDQCLAEGRPCGAPAAAAWCRSRAYAKAIDYGRMDPTEVTGSVPGGMKVSACTGRGCDELVAITCTR